MIYADIRGSSQIFMLVFIRSNYACGEGLTYSNCFFYINFTYKNTATITTNNSQSNLVTTGDIVLKWGSTQSLPLMWRTKIPNEYSLTSDHTGVPAKWYISGPQPDFRAGDRGASVSAADMKVAAPQAPRGLNAGGGGCPLPMGEG